VHARDHPARDAEVIYLMAAVTLVLFAFDFQNLLSLRRGKVLEAGSRRSDDFTVIIPLYGNPRYFAERERLASLKDHILVAMDVRDPVMAAFATQLEEEGWRVFCTVTNGGPTPPKLFIQALRSGSVTTTYAVRTDADSYFRGDLHAAIAALEDDGADLCSVKVLVANRAESWATRFQALEYDMSMLSRHYRPWLTSGAGFVGKTESLLTILDLHTMSNLGEDVETGLIANALRMRIRHLAIVVETDAPATWRALVRQRRVWWAGSFRHSVLNVDRNILHTPFWSFYYFGMVWVAVYFKIWGTLDLETFAIQLPVILAVYAFVTLASNSQVRSRLMLIYPLYAFTQSVVMPAIGMIWYFRLLARTRSLGRYRYGYRRVAPAAARPAAALNP
jgi:cellulose synthase/poly-beta-1,6-N-acetylglucosamine synthase-like glycosyltransferase